MLPRIVISSGEPAGIGIDLAVIASQKNYPAQLIILCDQQAFEQRALAINKPVNLPVYNSQAQQPVQGNYLYHIEAESEIIAGQLNVRNSPYVLDILDTAIEGCAMNIFDALVTAPLQKSVIAQTGLDFSGHTEYLADKTNTGHPVMMLTCKRMKVALATTHIPLAKVPAAITTANLETTIRIIHKALREEFNCPAPRIAVCGLNPHAGEGGHLGKEDQNIIAPAIDKMAASGMNISGPLPADTAFTQAILDNNDVILAMYHDQGLPVLKFAGFGNAVNVTLGLPIIRTSVDHGTALELAGTGNINFSSMNEAIELAIDMVHNK